MRCYVDGGSLACHARPSEGTLHKATLKACGVQCIRLCPVQHIRLPAIVGTICAGPGCAGPDIVKHDAASTVSVIILQSSDDCHDQAYRLMGRHLNSGSLRDDIHALP